MTAKQQSAWRSPWVQFWIGLLVVFVIANGIMLYLATEGNPGLTVDNFYDRGKNYERTVLQRMVRDSKWQMKILPPDYVDVAKPVRFGFSISDPQGEAVSPESVTFYVYRPADFRQDFSLPMHEVEPGRYDVEASFPLLGVWDVVVSAVVEGEEYNTGEYRFSAGVK